MRKFLTIMAWVILAICLAIGAAMCFAQYSHLTNMEGMNSKAIFDFAGYVLAIGIVAGGGMIASVIAAIASFFKIKAKEVK